jgi:OOP family OmpA-OmpF porin
LLTDVQTQLSVREWLLVQYYTVTANAVCKPPPPPPPAPPPPQAGPIVLRGVHFAFDRYNITPESAATLDEAASMLKDHSNVTVDVNGYCDAIGSVPYNLRLSEKRAEAVVGYLKDHGVTNNLVPHGYGKTHFVASNATAEGRAQNRRVELVPES